MKMKRTFAAVVALALGVVTLMPAFSSAAAGPNLILNPSMETSVSSQPANWLKASTGWNLASFKYETTGHTGSHSVTAKMSSRLTGDAKWYFAPVAVTPSTKYTFSNWYKSTVSTDLKAVVTTTSNTTQTIAIAAPAASSAWKEESFSFTTPANAKTVTFQQIISKNGSVTTDDYSLTADAVTPAPTPTAPAVNLTSPAADATVSGTVAVAANATDTIGMSNVQFKLDGVNLGAADTTAPYSVNWDTKTAVNGQHSLTAVATNTSNLVTTSTPIFVNVSNTTTPAPTAPVVSISSPANGATVSGATQAVSATVTDAQGVAGVQFKLDGANLGAADTTAPYSVNWDTTTATNASHTLTAVATNTVGLSTTSAPVAVTVSNTVPTPTPTPSPTNLISNPSVEINTGSQPTGWTADSWGTNTNALTYETNGQDGTRSVKATINTYSNGDAKWRFAPVKVTPNLSYKYSEYYKSNVDTEIDAEVTMADGSVQYFWLGALAPTTTWTKANAEFTAPANAASVSIFHAIAKVGYVQTDNYSLTEYIPSKLNRAIVSLTFDDGWKSIYTNGMPALTKYGFKSTQYVNSQPTMEGWTDYMTYAEIKDYYNKGHELAWHTQTHADLTTLTASQLNTELTIPSAFLQGLGLSASVFKNFATPFGAYNANVVSAIRAKYASHRSTDVGYNTKDNFTVDNIKVQNITKDTTAADVKAWVDKANTDKSWLVIVYHEVDTTPEDATYATTPALLDAQLNVIKQSGLTVETVGQAIAEVQPQI